MTTAPAPEAEPVSMPSDRDAAVEMAARLVWQCEGCNLKPYQDGAGNWTIGIGATRIDGNPVTADTPPLTLEQAEAFLAADLATTADEVDSAVIAFLTVPQKAACYSLAFNVGIGNFERSTLLEKLNAGDQLGAAGQFGLWIHDSAGNVEQGLVNRRKLERAVFVGAIRV